MQHRKGFTLVEILVVTAIVAVLAGIGYSVAAPARESARQTTCISNLKQMYSQWSLYTADWPGRTFPNTEMAYVSPSGQWEAFDVAKKPDVLFCPDSDRSKRHHMTTSYAMHMMTDIWSEPDAQVSKDMKAELERLGPLATGAACGDHDSFYYAPRETNVARELSRMFEIRLRFDGSVAKVRERRR
jgi:prepilin-type N-terminal cleavage/methylation domain-containing protein